MEEVNSGRTDIGPMIKRIEALHEYEKSRDVLAASIIAGFAADIKFVGPSVLITCDAASDLSTHKAFAEHIAQDIWTSAMKP